MLLKLVVLLSATVLTLSAPIVKEGSIETTPNSAPIAKEGSIETTPNSAPIAKEGSIEKTPNEEHLANLKDKSNGNNDSESIIEDNEQKKINPDESPDIKEILDKLDQSDITKVIEEEMNLNTKGSVDDTIISEIKKSDDTAQTSPIENEAKDKLSSTIPKKSDNAGIIEKDTEETASNTNKKNTDYSKDIVS